MIKNIIFDCGGVYIKISQHYFEELLAEIFSIELIEASTLWDKERKNLLLGKRKIKEYLEELRNLYTVELTLEEVVDKWNTFYFLPSENELNKELIEYTSNLAENYRLYMLTDTYDILDPLIKEHIYEKFIKIYRSCDLGMKKPDPETFNYVLEDAQINASETVFIDDREVNVEAARTLGMKGIVFKDNAQLKNELTLLGVDSNKV